MAAEADPARFVEVLEPAMRQAAVVARSLEGRVRNEPKSSESTPAKQALTVGDIASQEALLVPLLENFPDVRLAAEEDTPTVARFPAESQSLVVIDPIDGTLHSYLGGGGPYAVMMGLALSGRYAAAMVALPREGLFYQAVRGLGARAARAGGPARPARVVADGNRVLVSHGMPEAVCQRLRARGFEVIAASGGAVAVAPLITGVRAGLRYASGPTGISIRGRIGVLIAREAGAFVSGASGSAFAADLDSPAAVLEVACERADLEVLDDALSAAGLS